MIKLKLFWDFLNGLYFCSQFNMTEFPASLQLELMEEDQMAFGSDDLPPDEQQLEVLEDIWLKAGEIGKTPSDLYC